MRILQSPLLLLRMGNEVFGETPHADLGRRDKRV